MVPPLILASSSPYRKALLERLGLPFAAASPDVDESARPGESPRDLAARLALAKAGALASRYPAHLIIGSDQVAALGDHILGKPGSAENACSQLRRQSAQQVSFYTAVTLLDSASGSHRSAIDITRVTFRSLDDDEIRRYVAREQPWDCAGGFKVESLGIALFEQVETLDPTALTGLPLIGLTRLLRESGVSVIR